MIKQPDWRNSLTGIFKYQEKALNAFIDNPKISIVLDGFPVIELDDWRLQYLVNAIQSGHKNIIAFHILSRIQVYAAIEYAKIEGDEFGSEFEKFYGKNKEQFEQDQYPINYIPLELQQLILDVFDSMEEVNGPVLNLVWYTMLNAAIYLKDVFYMKSVCGPNARKPDDEMFKHYSGKTGNEWKQLEKMVQNGTRNYRNQIYGPTKKSIRIV